MPRAQHNPADGTADAVPVPVSWAAKVVCQMPLWSRWMQCGASALLRHLDHPLGLRRENRDVRQVPTPLRRQFSA
jgi:hypothetical protein